MDPVAQTHVTTLQQYLTRVVSGDFSQDLPQPSTRDEFSPLYSGIQRMVEVIREEFADLEKTNYQLQERVEEKVALLQSIGDGVVVLDQNQRITFINQAASQLIGWTPSEVKDKVWPELVPLQRVDGSLVPIDQRPLNISDSMDNADIAQHTYYYVKKDGSRFPISATTTPVKMETTQVGTIIIFRDITREKVVAQLKEDFLSIATHQLRSPLTTILWTLDIIMQNDYIDPAKLKTKLSSIKRNAQNMSELITDILTVTRLSNDSLKEEKKLCRVPELAKNIFEQLQPEVQERHLKLKLEVTHPELQTKEYLVDLKLFSQCLTHLLSNAIRYSHDQGVVTLTLGVQNTSLLIRVSDEGIGIPEIDKPHIFDKFYRGKNVPEGNLPGSGLGLFIVKSMVNQWGGTIALESQENQGTTITLVLPLPLAK